MCISRIFSLFGYASKQTSVSTSNIVEKQHTSITVSKEHEEIVSKVVNKLTSKHPLKAKAWVDSLQNWLTQDELALLEKEKNKQKAWLTPVFTFKPEEKRLREIKNKGISGVSFETVAKELVGQTYISEVEEKKILMVSPEMLGYKNYIAIGDFTKDVFGKFPKVRNLPDSIALGLLDRLKIPERGNNFILSIKPMKPEKANEYDVFRFANYTTEVQQRKKLENSLSVAAVKMERKVSPQTKFVFCY